MSLVGALVLTLRTSFVSKVLLHLVSFATGAILGTVFLHLLPEVMEHAGDPLLGSMLILGGMILAFGIEKFIHWHHCHSTEHDEVDGHHTHPLGALILIGDGIHNFIDGMLIVSSFAVSVPVGIATTLAVILHEIPQELSDVSLLLHSGFSRSKAILWNSISACTAIGGAVLALFFESTIEGVEYVLLPIAAGNFLYIATTDLIPELHRETRFSKSVQQVFLVMLGIVLMYCLSTFVHSLGLEAGHETTVHEDSVETGADGQGVLFMRVLDEHGHDVSGSVDVNVRTR